MKQTKRKLIKRNPRNPRLKNRKLRNRRPENRKRRNLMRRNELTVMRQRILPIVLCQRNPRKNLLIRRPLAILLVPLQRRRMLSNMIDFQRLLQHLRENRKGKSQILKSRPKAKRSPRLRTLPIPVQMKFRPQRLPKKEAKPPLQKSRRQKTNQGMIGGKPSLIWLRTPKGKPSVHENRFPPGILNFNIGFSSNSRNQ
jgi:hypothetical protein